MAGFSFGGLFNNDPLVDDDGKLTTINSQEYAGKYRTQVIASNSVSGNAATTLYTVPAGKVFFLAHYNINVDGNAAAAITFDLGVSILGVIIVSWTKPASITTDWQVCASALTMPIRIPAGDSIYIGCTHANGNMKGNISGWLEDA